MGYKKRLKNEKKKEAAKRKTGKDDDSMSNLTRSQKSSNASSKKRKTSNGKNVNGVARLCELCSAAGAPDFVYKSYYTNQCNKKDEYAKKLSDGVAQRSSAIKDIRSKESYKRRETKLINKVNHLKKQLKKKKENDSDVSSMSLDNTNLSR